MSQFEKLQKIAGENHGILQTSVVLSAGISKPELANFVKKYNFERVSHGVYCSPDSWQDDLYLFQLRCPQTVFSHDTALFLLGMTDREPLQNTITAKAGYNSTHLAQDNVKVFTVKKDLFILGITEARTTFGNSVSVYNPERTLCDIIRSRNSIEGQTFQDALKNYVRRKDKNLHQLMEFATAFRVGRKLRQYLEVLLS